MIYMALTKQLEAMISTLESTRVFSCSAIQCKYHDMGDYGTQRGLDCMLKNINITNDGKCAYEEE